MSMKRLDILFIALILFIIIVAIDSASLNRSTSIEKADVIVLLGGGDEGRVRHAGELYTDGYADYVFITSAHASEVDYQHLNTEEYGIPDEAIIYDIDANSTYEDATFTFNLMEEEGFESAIIVTSDYHIKRARMIFDRVNPNDYTLYFSGAQSEDGEWWYESDRWHILWWSEFIKYWGYELHMYNYF